MRIYFFTNCSVRGVIKKKSVHIQLMRSERIKKLPFTEEEVLQVNYFFTFLA